MSTIPHLPDCICDQRLDVFVCEVCERETPYCRGSDGDDLCDECWEQAKAASDESRGWTPEQQQRLEDAMTEADRAAEGVLP